MKNIAVVLATCLLWACSSYSSLEELVAEAEQTGDWSKVEERERILDLRLLEALGDELQDRVVGGGVALVAVGAAHAVAELVVDGQELDPVGGHVAAAPGRWRGALGRSVDLWPVC